MTIIRVILAYLFVYPPQVMLFNDLFTELLGVFFCLHGVTVTMNMTNQWLDPQTHVSILQLHETHSLHSDDLQFTSYETTNTNRLNGVNVDAVNYCTLYIFV